MTLNYPLQHVRMSVFVNVRAQKAESNRVSGNILIMNYMLVQCRLLSDVFFTQRSYSRASFVLAGGDL
jgi:hypothetical protein